MRSGRSRLWLFSSVLGAAFAAAALGAIAALAGEGNPNYLGILSSTAPTGYTPSPAFYSLAQGQNVLNFQFDVTNLTDGTQAMNLQLNLDHIIFYQGQDISDGQPGVVNGAVVDGQLGPSTQVQDPNPTLTAFSIGAHATETVYMSRTFAAGQCGYFQVDVAKEGLTNQTGLIGFEIRVLGCGTPSISTTASPVSGQVGTAIQDVANVTGGLSPTGTVTFALFGPGDSSCSGTNLVSGLSGFAGVPLSGGSASSAAYTTTQTGTFNWVARYNGDANNNPVSSACGAEQVTIIPASPAISTTPAPASGIVGVIISDSASVSGGVSPSGTVTFALFGPGDTTCAGPNLVASLSGFANVPLSGGSASSAGYATTQVGTFRWQASYSGDSNNNPAVSGCNAEQVTIQPATPAISTFPSPTQGTVGVVIHDNASVTGGFSPTGTVSFALFAPGDTTCAGANLVAGLSGFANVPLSSGNASSAGYTTTQVGSYRWVAAYSGDANNNPVVSGCNAEQVTITKPLGTQGCTPGFWKNPNHFALWTGYTPNELVSAVFNVPAVFPDGSNGTSLAGSSLAAALAFQGGSTLNGASQILLRAAVAALLNASNPNVAYSMTTSQIITAVNAALNSGDRTQITNLATQLDNANNGGCPLS